jgi:hypothetical protein
MCILLDRSGSTNDAQPGEVLKPWDILKSFAASAVQTIGDLQSQFEVRVFAAASEDELYAVIPPTRRSQLNAATIQKLLRIEHGDDASGTDIAAAISSCKVSLLNSNPPAVPPLKNVIILLTDGQQDGGDTSTDKLLAAAQDAKNAGMSIVTIRAGNFAEQPSPEQILAQARKEMRLVSGPGSGLYFEANTFDQPTLQRLEDDASKAACEARGSPGGYHCILPT